ncbi:MAG: Flp family type IVb pilin [Rickettsiales bacterium]|nr:Flp family type IVb pilin [Rickettsiales bacterium]|tara:strand:- start:831 stop:1049 length:219 start_codon:yes stop_codon:yes gene_type:complete
MIASNLSLIQDSARDAIARLHNDEKGQGMTEYVIILVAIAVVCIAIAVQFGGKIKALFETADSEIDTVDSNI